MKKKFLPLMLLLAVLALVLASCGGGEEEPAAEEAQFNVAIVMPNPLGDRSFIDSSARGIERANAELPVDA